MFHSSAATLYGVPIRDSQISLSKAAFVLFLLALGLQKRSLANSPQSSSDSDGNILASGDYRRDKLVTSIRQRDLYLRFVQI